MSKLTSRKFWISVAAFLGSIGASIAGLACNYPAITTIGIICAVFSAAIYAAIEASVDKASINAEIDEEIQLLEDGYELVIDDDGSVLAVATDDAEDKEDE